MVKKTETNKDWIPFRDRHSAIYKSRIGREPIIANYGKCGKLFSQVEPLLKDAKTTAFEYLDYAEKNFRNDELEMEYLLSTRAVQKYQRERGKQMVEEQKKAKFSDEELESFGKELEEYKKTVPLRNQDEYYGRLSALQGIIFNEAIGYCLPLTVQFLEDNGALIKKDGQWALVADFNKKNELILSHKVHYYYDKYKQYRDREANRYISDSEKVKQSMDKIRKKLSTDSGLTPLE